MSNLQDDYYDLDSILSSEVRVPITLTSGGTGLGFLDSTIDDADLSPGHRLDLPLWLCKALSSRGYGDIDVPKSFSSRFRTYLLADPLAVNLCEREPFFYHVGLELAESVRESRAIVHALIKSLAVRYRDILDKAQNSRDEDLESLMRKLTALEKEIFRAGHHGAVEMFRWKRREMQSIHASGARKRQRRR